MKIIIDDTSLLSIIQKEFSSQFPFLKLKVFICHDNSQDPFTKINLITDTCKMIRDIRQCPYSGPIYINADQKVISLENNFKKKFGLNVQIFTKSGNSWIKTLSTDDLTIGEQNKKGEAKSKDLEEELLKDYELYYEQI